MKSPQFLPHPKLVITKGKVALFSSANLTSNSLGSGFSSAVEAGLYFTAAEDVRDLAHAFVALWDSCGLAQDLYEERIALQSVQAAPLRQDTLPTKIGDTLELCWSCHDVSDSLRKRLIEEISKAKSRVILAAMSFYDADRVPELEPVLLAALLRGVEVTVIVRPEQFSAKQYPDPSTRRLLVAGLCLLGITGLHAKGFLVDGDHCGILSANFNPYSIGGAGVSSNFEMALCGQCSNKALAPFAKFLCALPGAATHRFEIG
jgi:phosphatidylserine/phosphatidylglycerophosphate/cardiolipin synthase-like enzyme